MFELSTSQILRLLQRWWWVMVLCPVLAAGTAFLLSQMATPVYEADTTLLIDRTQTSGDSTSYNDVLVAERLSQTYSRLVTTRAVFEETIDELNLSMTPEELRGSISVSPLQETQLLEISAEHTDPDQAAAIVNTLAEVFIGRIENQQTPEIASSASDLQPTIDDLESQISETTGSIEELESQNNASSESVQTEIQRLRNLRSTYQSTLAELLEIQQRMSISEAEAGIRVSVADPAIASDSPISPRPVFNASLAGIFGIIVAVGIILILGYLDNTVKTAEDVRRLTGKAAIGVIPRLKHSERLNAINDMQSQAAEAYRGLRTNLQFATIGSPVRSLAVTSVRPGDGKSTTTLYLGLVLAQGGQRVIIIDADLRRPQMHHMVAGLHNRSGLTNILLSKPDVDLAQYLQSTDVPSLQILTTGPLPPNPVDVLNSPHMQEVIIRFQSQADIVLIDSLPAVFSEALITASLADGTLLVVESGEVRSNEFTDTVHTLTQSGKPLIGTVLNKLDPDQETYRRYEYYRRYYNSNEIASQEAVTAGGAERDRGSRLRRLLGRDRRPASRANHPEI